MRVRRPLYNGAVIISVIVIKTKQGLNTAINCIKMLLHFYHDVYVIE